MAKKIRRVWSWGYLETKYGQKWRGASLRDNGNGTTDVLMRGKPLTPKQAAIVTSYVEGDPDDPEDVGGRIDF